jgi:hypothetical protein
MHSRGPHRNHYGRVRIRLKIPARAFPRSSNKQILAQLTSVNENFLRKQTVTCSISEPRDVPASREGRSEIQSLFSVLGAQHAFELDSFRLRSGSVSNS